MTRVRLCQLAFILTGLALTTSTDGRINGLFIIGFALAGFGAFRLGAGLWDRTAK